MIICPSCGAQIFRPDYVCAGCNFLPKKVDGFLAWAPELAKYNDGFPKKSFLSLSKIEAGNFWFRARNTIAIWALRKYFQNFKSLLEVGCGTGFLLQSISKEFPNSTIVGSEIYTEGLSYAAKRLPNVELIQIDARKIPFKEEFDVVLAFDVIEHILEDELVLRNFHQAIKPGGGCLITVPQHKWLWSPVDDAACHKRRYSYQELYSKMEAADFSIVRSTSFVTLLLPLMLASRVAARISGKGDGSEELALNPLLDKLLSIIMRIEFFLIKFSMSLPVGGSLLLVAKRKG